CFAGTGSMGLECLSRGAARATFFEADRPAIARLRRNIETLGEATRGRVVAGDLFRWFATGANIPPASERPAIVFLDPPYRFLAERATQLKELAGTLARDYLAPGGLVVFRHDTNDALDLPPFRPADARRYGG